VSPQPLPDPAAAAAWLRARVRGTLRTDSRRVQPGDGFLAWPGRSTDARHHVPQALAAGAAACLVERAGVEAWAFDDARIAALAGLAAQAGEVADACFDRPSAALDVVAVTGTNGKTSTAWWTAQALGALGRRCALVGTLGIGEPPRIGAAGGEPPPIGAAAAPGTAFVATGLTTPDAVQLHAALRGFVDRGCTACAIEASSIGLEQSRLAGLRIAVAQFSNLSRDHLDHHGTLAAYWAAKRRLFDWPGLRAAVVNVDDAHGAELAAALRRAGRIDVWTCSTRGAARLAARDLRHGRRGLDFTLAEDGGAALPVASPVVGEFNVANLLLVVGALRALGVALADAAAVVPALGAVPGRMQRVAVPAGAPAAALPEVVVDYAHSPDALAHVLAALRPLAAARGGRLWCVFGCGGDRDPGKRAPMGEIAARGADRVVLTSDNPRSEPPAAILAQIAAGAAGAAHVRSVEDRAAAIAQAVAEADARDVVLIAGKGHEDTQEAAGVRRPFSDAAEAARALAARAGGAR
jgi:UDP-N-acetylmuramoyl-L-alanyl-D-glutamate--2,6-diaminopimelate ligase